ncbi:hypothetical protein ES703_111576 [subsurface metagenome]
MGRRRKYCSAQPYLDHIGVSERERKEWSKEDEMKTMAEKLKDAKKRNPDAYKIIGVVSGFGEKKIKEIAEGKEPSSTEKIILEGLSTME